MTTRRLPLPRAAVLAVSYVLAGPLLSCSREPVSAPRGVADGPALAAKPAANPTVTATNPPFGDQGTTVDVHVIGTGFSSGANATWKLHGIADPAHVRTNSTRFVSSTEVVANITIASDAQLAFWDVEIALAGGKNGVGTEAFEVTSAQILGSGTTGGDVNVMASNDLQQVVGYAQTAFVYDDAIGMVSLGAGQAWGIDPLGTLVVGRGSDFRATAWVRQLDDRWLPEFLPRLAGSVESNGAKAARAPDGTLLVAGWDGIASSKNKNVSVNRPVLWRRSGAGWSVPLVYALPVGASAAVARSVNGLGQIVGEVDAGATGAVWDGPTTPTRLDGRPSAINESGTVVVGRRGNTAVYWWRDRVTGAWHTTGVPLPAIAGAQCTSGSARAVNTAGVIVGSSCNGDGKDQATVWVLDLSGPAPALANAPTALPGLGVKNNNSPETSSAGGVTETTPYVAFGGVVSTGSRVAVRWHLLP
jgi:hypothetical protein